METFSATLQTAIDQAVEAYASQAAADTMKALHTDTLHDARERWLQTAKLSNPHADMRNVPWSLETAEERKRQYNGLAQRLMYRFTDIADKYPDVPGATIHLEEFKDFCFPQEALLDMLIKLLRDAMGLKAEAQKAHNYYSSMPVLIIKAFVSPEWQQKALEVVPRHYLASKVRNLQQRKEQHLADLKTYQAFIEDSPKVLQELDQDIAKFTACVTKRDEEAAAAAAARIDNAIRKRARAAAAAKKPKAKRKC